MMDGYSVFAKIIKSASGIYPHEEDHMLWTILILIFLWLLGRAAGYTMGYSIHILLLVAITFVLVRTIHRRRVL